MKDSKRLMGSLAFFLFFSVDDLSSMMRDYDKRAKKIKGDERSFKMSLIIFKNSTSIDLHFRSSCEIALCKSGEFFFGVVKMLQKIFALNENLAFVSIGNKMFLKGDLRYVHLRSSTMCHSGRR